MARPLQKDEPGWHAGSWEAPSLYQAWPRQRPGGNLEVQDNDKSTDDLNSYWVQVLQTKLNLSESMNAVDLVYCPVFNTSALLVRQARKQGDAAATRAAQKKQRQEQ